MYKNEIQVKCSVNYLNIAYSYLIFANYYFYLSMQG